MLKLAVPLALDRPSSTAGRALRVGRASLLGPRGTDGPLGRPLRRRPPAGASPASRRERAATTHGAPRCGSPCCAALGWRTTDGAGGPATPPATRSPTRDATGSATPSSPTPAPPPAPICPGVPPSTGRPSRWCSTPGTAAGSGRRPRRCAWKGKVSSCRSSSGPRTAAAPWPGCGRSPARTAASGCRSVPRRTSRRAPGRASSGPTRCAPSSCPTGTRRGHGPWTSPSSTCGLGPAADFAGLLSRHPELDTVLLRHRGCVLAPGPHRRDGRDRLRRGQRGQRGRRGAHRRRAHEGNGAPAPAGRTGTGRAAALGPGPPGRRGRLPGGAPGGRPARRLPDQPVRPPLGRGQRHRGRHGHGPAGPRLRQARRRLLGALDVGAVPQRRAGVPGGPCGRGARPGHDRRGGRAAREPGRRVGRRARHRGRRGAGTAPTRSTTRCAPRSRSATGPSRCDDPRCRPTGDGLALSRGWRRAGRRSRRAAAPPPRSGARPRPPSSRLPAGAISSMAAAGVEASPSARRAGRRLPRTAAFLRTSARLRPALATPPPVPRRRSRMSVTDLRMVWGSIPCSRL